MESVSKLNLKGDVAHVELAGHLDANKAPELMDQLKSLIGKKIKRIVFHAKELEYISSAGIRAIIFSKQKIGENIDLYLVSAQESVKEVIDMTGLTDFMILTEEYKE